MKPRWVPKAAVLAIHEWLLAEHGGATGLLDEGALDAALASPMNHLGYSGADVFRLASAYASSLTRNHPFQDGNKRVALTVAGVFLEMNGFRLQATESEAVRATVGLSTRDLDEDSFARWLKANSARLERRGPGGARKTASARKKAAKRK